MGGSRCNRSHVQSLSGIGDGQVGCTKLQLSARGCVSDAHGRPVSPNPAECAATLDCHKPPRSLTVRQDTRSCHWWGGDYEEYLVPGVKPSSV